MWHMLRKIVKIRSPNDGDGTNIRSSFSTSREENNTHSFQCAGVGGRIGGGGGAPNRCVRVDGLMLLHERTPGCIVINKHICISRCAVHFSMLRVCLCECSGMLVCCDARKCSQSARH